MAFEMFHKANGSITRIILLLLLVNVFGRLTILTSEYYCYAAWRGQRVNHPIVSTHWCCEVRG
jgi:hypothetical protein